MDDQFVYDNFAVDADRRTVHFRYHIVQSGIPHDIDEVIVFPITLKDSTDQLRSLRALHLALGVSYYKTFLAPVISQPYALDEAEVGFWNTVWRNGLGEFLYVNKLSPDKLARFETNADGRSFPNPENEEESTPANGALLGIGGGKDSVVAGELLKSLGCPLTGFVMATGEQLGQAEDVAAVMGISLLAVKRTIDSQLLTLQEQPGAHKGHVPISLIFGLVGTTLAIAGGYTYVTVANEAAASIPRTEWNGMAVNHQWSKSFSFERQLQNYVHEHITPSVAYFSPIRQLTSVGVAKLFARYPSYFEVFTSDNSVFRIDPSKRPSGRWSLESPKSLSSYILLTPWLSDADVSRIFGFDLLNEPSLEPLFKSLTGIEGEPPLDCVGTVEELVLSLNLLDEQNRYQHAAFMRLARQTGVITEAAWQAELGLMLQLQSDQALPSDDLGLAIPPKLQGMLQS